MIDIEAHNREVQDKRDKIASEMWEEVDAEKFFSYLDLDEVMALFTTALEGRSDRCLKQALIDMALHANNKWDDETRAEKDELHDFCLDQHGVDRFGSEAAAKDAWQQYRRTA